MLKLVANTRLGPLWFKPETMQIYLQANATSDLVELDFSNAAPPADEEGPDDNSPRLGRLALTIASACNLACDYCYADQGHYGHPAGLMAPETAVDLVTEALERYRIDSVMFFGGEPSLNVEAIIEVALFLEAVTERGLLPVRPRLTAISNFASARMPEFLAVAARFGMDLTASVDGPPELHDLHRRTRGGDGSYAACEANILHARALGIPVGIQCTYSGDHVRAGLSIADLMQFFHRRYGLVESHIAPVRPLDNARVVDAFTDGIRYMLSADNVDGLRFTMAAGMLRRLVTRDANQIHCPAMNSELTVGPDGRLFPCFMLAGNPETCLGQWRDGQTIKTDQADRLAAEARAHRSACADCWVRGLCSGCLAGDYLEAGRFGTPSPSHCHLMQAMARQLIHSLTINHT